MVIIEGQKLYDLHEEKCKKNENAEWSFVFYN